MGHPPQATGRRALVPYVLALRLAILLVWCGVQVSCIPPMPPAPSYITLEQVRGMVSVFRQGQAIAVHVPMPLAIGDVVQTGADATATIRYPAGHEVRLMPDTRVQLASIFVFFGEIFVQARGFFRVENEFVSLEVEGTEFWFRVERDQSVATGVLAGRVRLASKLGRWTPIRMSRGEVYTVLPNGRPIREAQRLPPVPPPPPEYGWCCVDGQLSRDDATDCRWRGGRFFTSESQARQLCREPRGWCCTQNGRVVETTQPQCTRAGGRLYRTQREAGNDRRCRIN
jgi:FecR protein